MPGPATIDLSGGMVSTPPPAPSGGIDLSAGLTAPSPSTPPPGSRPAQDLISARFGPDGTEGSYAMHDFAGTPHNVGYSKVHQALDQGFLFADKPTLQKFARDHAADPLDESRVDQWIDKHPIVTGPLQGLIGGYRGLIRTGTSFDRTPTTRGETEAQLFAATPNRTWQEGAGGLAENYGEFEALGAAPGAALELFKGEQLLGLLGRAGNLMSAAEKLKTVTGLAQIIEKVPMVGKLLKIGESAAKQGATAGTQTYVQTHDPNAAMTSGALGAVAGPAAELVGATGTAINTLRKGTGEAAASGAAEAAAREAQATANVAAADREAAAMRQTAEQRAAQSRTAAEQHAATLRTTAEQNAARSRAAAEQHTGILQETAERNVSQAQAAAERQAAEAQAAAERQTAADRASYAEHARAAIHPHLEETNIAARQVPQQELMATQPGGSRLWPQPPVPTGRMVATATGKPVPQINIDHVLNQVHDFTGAADHLAAVNDDAYNEFDLATGGRFRALNAEVMNAQNAMRKGEAGAAELYKSKLAQMDQLMESTSGEMIPEMKDAAKRGFRQSYMLRDFGNLWDRNFGGVPGASQASQTQRGINGKGLLTDLQRAVKLYGRPQIEEALGPGRLSNLEEIAQQNITDGQRKAFNSGLRTVAQELAHLEAQHPGPATTTVAQELGRLKTQYPGPATTTVAQELARLKAEVAATQGPAPAKVQKEIARLEAIADKTKPVTNPMSALGKRALAMAAGGAVQHLVTGSGTFYGMMAGEATYETSRMVLNALKTNPKIAKNFLFALQSGARAERYGPLIASMIQKSISDSTRDQQAREQERQR